MFCTIRYHLYNFKKVKNIHGAKNNTPPWMLFTFLKLYKQNQIAQRISDIQNITSKYKIKSMRFLQTKSLPCELFSYPNNSKLQPDQKKTLVSEFTLSLKLYCNTSLQSIFVSCEKGVGIPLNIVQLGITLRSVLPCSKFP